MPKRKLGKSGLEIAPLVLGGNVFGWTADRDASFAVLDAFVGAGFDAVDTANDASARPAPAPACCYWAARAMGVPLTSTAACSIGRRDIA